MRILRLIAMAALLAVSTMPDVGFAQNPRPSNAEWNQVIQAAKQEGKVVLYTGATGSPVNQKIVAGFEAKYGIRLEVLEARASELRERIRTEQATGRVLGDLSHNGSTTTELQLHEGVFVPYVSLPNARLASPFKADGTRASLFVIPYGILVNTDLVKPADEPKSWKDLLDPKWRDKILADDFRALGGGSVFFMVTQLTFGRQYHDALAAQRLRFSRELRNNQRRTARGEFPIYIPMLLPDILDLQGLPVKAIVPAEGVPYVAYEGAILKGAPHPNAARLLLDYLLGDEVQLTYANLGYGAVTAGMQGKAQPAARPYAEAKLLGTTDAKLQDEMLKLARQIYK